MPSLERFLRTAPGDAGCDETRRLLHVVAEDVAANRPPRFGHPGIAAHLRDCPPCADELEGLLAAIEERPHD